MLAISSQQMHFGSPVGSWHMGADSGRMALGDSGRMTPRLSSPELGPGLLVGLEQDSRIPGDASCVSGS